MPKGLKFKDFFALLHQPKERQKDIEDNSKAQEDMGPDEGIDPYFDANSMLEAEEDSWDNESMKNPFTDSSFSEWAPYSSDEESTSVPDELIETDENLRFCEPNASKSSPLNIERGASISSQTVDRKEDDVVSDSGSSVASIQYPMLSVTSTDAPCIGIQPKSRKWSKYHAYYFCEKLVIKMARHLEVKHKNESYIAQILMLPKGSTERRKGWVKLINDGDYKHNFEVLEKGKGIVIPKYRGKNKGVQGFVPCSTCKGLYRRNKLAAHSIKCCPGQKGKAYREGSLMLPVPRHVSKSLWQKRTANTRTKGGKRKWTQQERLAVLKHLSVFIQMKKVPGKADVEKVMKKEECLNERSWRNFKDFCYNEVKKQ